MCLKLDEGLEIFTVDISSGCSVLFSYVLLALLATTNIHFTDKQSKESFSLLQELSKAGWSPAEEARNI